MSHTEKAAFYLNYSASLLRQSAMVSAEERKVLLVEASNYALLASQELAVEHSDFCQSK